MTFLGVIHHIENAIDFSTVGLLRESGEASSADMFQFQIYQYIEKENLKPNPDIGLKYFDFSGFSRDWISPLKKYETDKIGHLSLADIIKTIFKEIALPKSFSKRFKKAIKDFQVIDNESLQLELLILFYDAINNKKHNPHYAQVFHKFIEFGRMIYKHEDNNLMGLQQTAKMMAPCFAALIFGPELSSSDLRKYSSFFQYILERCLSLPEPIYSQLIHFDKKALLSKDMKPILKEITEFFEIKNDSYSTSPPRQSMESSASCSSAYDDGPDVSLALTFSTLSLRKTDIFDFAKTGNLEELRRYFNQIEDPCIVVNSLRSLFDRSLLHVAVLFQQPDIVRYLSSIGAQINITDRHGRTPIHYAARWTHIGKPFHGETLDALFEIPGAALSCKIRKDMDKKSALDYAKEYGTLSEFSSCIARRKAHPAIF